jgi:hypothetical protein
MTARPPRSSFQFPAAKARIELIRDKRGSSYQTVAAV